MSTAQKHRNIHEMSMGVRKFLADTYGFEKGEDIIYLAYVLSFIIQGTDAAELSALMQLNKNRFPLRKLRSVLGLLDKVFNL